MQALMTAVLTRWNAAGLNSSLGLLYPAGEGRASTRNVGGAPETDDLPRFEYMVIKPPAQQKSRNSRITQASAVFHLWGKTALLSSGYVSSVWSAFTNADEAPMSLSNGDILEVDDGGSFVEKVDDGVWLGQQLMLIRTRVDQP